ncbi:hypothetical protein [Rhizobium sp. 11515TR]|uniref:hypothetical protein n=1 Tax=Rhizobium sp. 11515TR TaxID=2028343 RepID=UPI000BA840AE|nr:hypothetical protein [Rhizobium sp. 11515TR]ASW06275.1 hypothetical protein CKA34_10520 [Rhizobium sp. 11515TR]
MSNFHVGQKVVCIVDANRKITDLGFPMFKKGQVLTISAMEMSDACGALPEKHLFLSFQECDPRQFGHHAGFRPIVERKTDISVFTDMLNYQPKVVVLS